MGSEFLFKSPAPPPRMTKRLFVYTKAEVIFLTITFLRTVILYLLVIVAFRLMGKRQVGELSPSELVVAIMISELAAHPAQDSSLPLLSGVVPILTLAVLEISLSFLALKFSPFRRLLTGRSVTLISHGKIVERDLEKLRLNVDDLLEEMRLAGYTSLSEIEYMILETGGKVSVIPKKEYAPATVGDVGAKGDQATPSAVLVADGKLRKSALSALGRSEKWVYGVLRRNKIKRTKDCFLLTADQSGQVYVQKKEGV